MRLDGDINILLQGNTSSANTHESALLFDLDSTVQFQDDETGAADAGGLYDFDFRVSTVTQGVEIRITPKPGEDIIYFESANGATRGLRAANGTFLCDFEARICEDGSQIFRW